MHADRQPALTRAVDLPAGCRHRRRLRSLQREREGHPVAGLLHQRRHHATGLRGVGRVRVPPLELRELAAHRGSVREYRADRELAVSADRRLAVLGRVDDVAPVEYGGDAVLQRVDDRGASRDVDVLGREARRQPGPDRRVQRLQR